MQLAHVHAPPPPLLVLEGAGPPFAPRVECFEVVLLWLNKELAEVFGLLKDEAFLPLERDVGCCLVEESRGWVENDLARLTEEGSVALVDGGTDGGDIPK